MLFVKGIPERRYCSPHALFFWVPFCPFNVLRVHGCNVNRIVATHRSCRSLYRVIMAYLNFLPSTIKYQRNSGLPTRFPSFLYECEIRWLPPCARHSPQLWTRATRGAGRGALAWRCPGNGTSWTPAPARPAATCWSWSATASCMRSPTSQPTSSYGRWWHSATNRPNLKAACAIIGKRGGAVDKLGEDSFVDCANLPWTQSIYKYQT